MNLDDSTQEKVNFANFCISQSVEPYELGVLLSLVKRRADHETWMNNSGIDDPSEDEKNTQLRNRVDLQIRKCGLVPDGWSGLIPSSF